MAMTAVKCPECGAKLSPAPTALQITCEYCQTTSRVQRKTRWFRAPPPPPGDPRQPVAQPSSWVLWVYLGPVLAGVVLSLGVAAFRALSPDEAESRATGDTAAPDAAPAPVVIDAAPTADAPPPKPPQHRVESRWPAFADANADGFDDLVVLLSPVDTTRPHVGVLDGRTGEVLWESFGVGSRSSHPLIAVAGEVVIAAGPGERADSFDLATGLHRWSRRLAERPLFACTTGDDFVELALARQRLVRIAADGVVTARGRAPRDARGCRSRAVVDQPPLEHERAQAPADSADTLRNMTVRARVWRDGGPHVALGVVPGTAVPVVARYQPPRELVWERPVTSLRGDVGTWPSEGARLALGDDVAVVVFSDTVDGTRGNRAAAFDLSDGTPRWEVPVASGVSLVNVAVRGDTVFITGGGLEALALEDGSTRWRYGP